MKYELHISKCGGLPTYKTHLEIFSCLILSSSSRVPLCPDLRHTASLRASGKSTRPEKDQFKVFFKKNNNNNYTLKIQ